MTASKFFFKEMRYRKKGLWANLLVVVVAAATVSFLLNTSSSSKRSIQLITKNMGHNLILIHNETRPEDYYTASGNERSFPFEWTSVLSKMAEVVTTYHVGILQRRDTLAGHSFILTGALPIKGQKEATPSDKKNPFIDIPQGTIRIGSEVARELRKKEKDTLLLRGAVFTIGRIEKENGTTDDYRLYLNLKEMQKQFGQTDSINAVLAMECLCEGEPLSVTERRIRNAIVKILPDIKVMTLSRIATARYEAREVTDAYNRIIITLLMAAVLAFIMIGSWSEARQREKESALLTALGFPSSLMVRLYAFKALIIALPASALGLILGTALSMKLGEGIAKAKMVADTSFYPYVVVAAVLLVFAGFIPALLKSLRTDPFDILREE